MKSLVTAILVLICGTVSFGSIILYTPSAGDCTASWNTKSSSIGYGSIGGNTMGVYLSFGGSYGNDYTVSIFEIPIASLSGKTLSSATLEVDSLGFDTGYYSGSAQIGWFNTGTSTLTGNVVADELGSTKPLPGGYEIWDTYDLPNGAGAKSFDFTTQVQTDIDAGRTYSTFVLHGSRETYGSIYTSESGQGPRIVATLIPEPATLLSLAFGFLMLRKKK